MGEIGSVERYVRVLLSSLNHPKFIGLTAAERGTWVTSLLLADIAHPAPFHEAAVLKECPDATFERLLERELIEQTERPGWLRIHDLKQFHVAPSQEPSAVAARVAKHRAKKAGNGASPPTVTPVTDVTSVTDVTTDETRETRRDDSTREEGRIGRSGRAVDDREGGRHSRPTSVRGFRTAIEG